MGWTPYCKYPVVYAERGRGVYHIKTDLNHQKEFNDFASTKGIVGIKGHRSVGGFRASLYNAMSMEGVQVLIDAMKEFEKNH